MYRSYDVREHEDIQNNIKYIEQNFEGKQFIEQSNNTYENENNVCNSDYKKQLIQQMINDVMLEIHPLQKNSNKIKPNEKITEQSYDMSGNISEKNKAYNLKKTRKLINEIKIDNSHNTNDIIITQIPEFSDFHY